MSREQTWVDFNPYFDVLMDTLLPWFHQPEKQCSRYIARCSAALLSICMRRTCLAISQIIQNFGVAGFASFVSSIEDQKKVLTPLSVVDFCEIPSSRPIQVIWTQTVRFSIAII